LSVLVPAATCGCATDAAGGPAVDAASPVSTSAVTAEARVIVTTDFGADTVVDATVELADQMSAMQALQSVADVGTAYGGGFVQSIDGIGQSRSARHDWFYAVNGVLANRGAANQTLRGGDIEHWDFRDWGFRRNVSATLGCFPAFFANGFGGLVRPTVVAYASGYQSESAAIAEALSDRGVTAVECVDLSTLPEEWQQERNLILVGDRDEPLIGEVLSRWDKLGLFVEMDTIGMFVFSAAGTESVVSGDAIGLLQPVQNPWNPSGIGACQTVALLVTGADTEGVRNAAAALLENGDEMATWCGAVVSDGAVQPIPSRTP
jgi:hypothetical protein